MRGIFTSLFFIGALLFADTVPGEDSYDRLMAYAEGGNETLGALRNELSLISSKGPITEEEMTVFRALAERDLLPASLDIIDDWIRGLRPSSVRTELVALFNVSEPACGRSLSMFAPARGYGMQGRGGGHRMHGPSRGARHPFNPNSNRQKKKAERYRRY